MRCHINPYGLMAMLCVQMYYFKKNSAIYIIGIHFSTYAARLVTSLLKKKVVTEVDIFS